MEYNDIDSSIRRYVKKSTYTKLDMRERKAYLKAVKHVIHKMEEEMDDLSDSSTEPISVELMVVESTYILDPYTKVKLEMSNHGKYSLEMLAKDDDHGWVHAGYVRESDAAELMKYKRLLDKKIMYVQRYKMGHKYRLFL
jgi:hypothetical protein